MTARMTTFGISLAGAVVFTLGSTMVSWADDEDEIPFADADLFFELNNTDGDLGIHALIDGEPWKKLVIEDLNERQMLSIRVTGRLRRQGLTELAFESAEPTFDELPPEVFFERFPEGEYEIEGLTLDHVELESIVELTHLLPAPPEIAVNGIDLPEDCDADLPTIAPVDGSFTIGWNAVALSHPDLGRTNEPIEIEEFEVVAAREDEPAFSFGANVPPDVTELRLPAELTASGDEIKVEVLVTGASGNRTATESCFEVE